MTISIALSLTLPLPETGAPAPQAPAAITSTGFDAASAIWDVTTDRAYSGTWTWARVAATAADPVPDGAGGWAGAVDDSGSEAVGAPLAALALGDTASPGGSYKLALYQRTAAGDSNVLIQPYAAPALAPDAFAASDWSAASAGGGAGLEITIAALPAANGSPVSDIAYRIDGGSWVSSGGTADFSIAGVTPGLRTIALRAVNARGASPTSDIKTVLVSGTGPAPVIASDSFDDLTDTWQITTTRENDGSYVWARLAAGAADPSPDGDGGWSTPVQESGAFAVAPNGTGYAIAETGSAGQSYKLALYQRSAGGQDSNVLTQLYTATGSGADVAVATASALVLNDSTPATSFASAGYTAAGGANNCLVIRGCIVHNQSASTIDFSHVTVMYDGQACTIARGAADNITPNVNSASFIAYLMDPPTTPEATAILTLRNSANTEVEALAAAVSVVELSGVDATAPIGVTEAKICTASSDTIQTEITPAHEGSWVATVASVIRANTPSMTPTSDTTSDHNDVTGTLNFSDMRFVMGHNEVDTAAALALGVTEANKNASTVAVEFKPS